MSENLIVAIVGVVGAIIGSAATMAGQMIKHCLEQRAAAKRDEPRKRLLRQMLENEEWPWRNLSTLTHVIGADEEMAKRLLLEIGARASEDGKELWGLVSRHPLPRERQ